jgi:hypothetical protein
MTQRSPMLVLRRGLPVLPASHRRLIRAYQRSQTFPRQAHTSPSGHDPLSRGTWFRMRIVPEKLDDLRHVLEKHNITAIEPLGEKLDPNLHQAMVQSDHPDAEAGTIVQVMQIGYRIHDRLLRAAMVAVAKGNGGGNAAGQQVDTEA